MVAERKIFEEEGLEKYVQYQQKNEDEPLKAGAAFPFVKVILITGCPIEGYHNFLIKALLCVFTVRVHYSVFNALHL